MKPGTFVYHLPKTVEELAVGVLEREPDISDEDLLDVLSSDLCRCTGYQNIIKAVRAATTRMRAR
jgi:carbon-monoxide dehydrogenase small subunit